MLLNVLLDLIFKNQFAVCRTESVNMYLLSRYHEEGIVAGTAVTVVCQETGPCVHQAYSQKERQAKEPTITFFGRNVEGHLVG